MRSVSLESKEASTLLKDALNKDQVVSLTVTGHSMKPLFIHKKTVVYVEKPKKSFTKNDVILVSLNEQLILHRIIKLDPLTTRGDALRKSEEVLLKDVLGIVLRYNYIDKEYNVKRIGWRFRFYTGRMILYLKLIIRKVKRGS